MMWEMDGKNGIFDEIVINVQGFHERKPWTKLGSAMREGPSVPGGNQNKLFDYQVTSLSTSMQRANSEIG